MSITVRNKQCQSININNSQQQQLNLNQTREIKIYTSDFIWKPSVDINGDITWEKTTLDNVPIVQNIKGTSGDTPYIGDNGNWWISNVDTGTPAEITSNSIANALGYTPATQQSVDEIKQDAFYTHVQATASNEWTVIHNLNKMPSVSVVDSAKNVVIGDVEYIDENSLIVRFQGSFSGKCYCN